MNSLKLWNRIDITFINSENSKTSDPQTLSFNLSDKINLKISDKYVALWNLRIYYNGEIWKGHTKIIDLKYQLRQGMKSLNYLMGYILYQIFKTIFEYIIKKHETVTDNPSINRKSNHI